MATIGLDIGTTGCKATAVDERGTTIFEKYVEYNLTLPRPGWVELDPQTVWNGVKTVLAAVSKNCGQLVTSLAVASFGEACVMLDKKGQVVANSIFFTDVRGYEYVDALVQDLGRDWIEMRTGMPVNGMYTLLKLLWLKDHRSDLFGQIDMLLPFASYITYRLTGIAACDHSLASRTLMLDRTSLEWERDLVRYGGLDVENLPQLVPAGEPVGVMLPSVAAELGFSTDTLVVSGCHDQVAAALGAGVRKPGQAADGIGSAECITAMLPDDAELDVLFPKNICAEPYAIAGGYVALAFNNTAGAALKWYRDTFKAELRNRCKQLGQSAFRFLDGEITAEPSPLLFLPYLSGAGTPYMDSGAKGMLYGLTLGTQDRDVYRAIIEGMNYEMKLNLQLLAKSGLKLSSLTAVGGGASSKIAMQIKADILQLPVNILENPQSGNIGLSILCAVAEKRHPGIEQAMEDLVRVKEVIVPDRSHAARYEESYVRYAKLYEAAKLIG